MESRLFVDGEWFITTPDAARISGYSVDYLSRLCREGQVLGKQVGRAWYLAEASLRTFLDVQDTLKKKRHARLAQERKQEYAGHQQEQPAPAWAATAVGENWFFMNTVFASMWQFAQMGLSLCPPMKAVADLTRTFAGVLAVVAFLFGVTMVATTTLVPTVSVQTGLVIMTEPPKPHSISDWLGRMFDGYVLSARIVYRSINKVAGHMFSLTAPQYKSSLVMVDRRFILMAQTTEWCRAGCLANSALPTNRIHFPCG